MALFALIGTAALSAATLVVGIRLLLLWTRTRQLPELFLGSGIFFSGFVGNGLSVVRAVFPDLPASFSLVANTCWAYGCWCALIVAWRVFRPRSRVAALVAGINTLLLGVYLYEIQLRGGDLPYPTLLYWAGGLGVAAPYFWAATEALRYQASLRRRHRLGLQQDAVLVTRMLLWGIAFGAIAMAWTAIYSAPLLTRFGGTGLISLLIAIFGLVCAGSLWLAFFMPQSMKRRL